MEAAEERFKNCTFYALVQEKEKKFSQFEELIMLEFEWLSGVVEDLPSMLPKEEFVVLPTKTPSKKKIIKEAVVPPPTLELDDSSSNLVASSATSIASTSSRPSRKPKESKSKSKHAQRLVADFREDSNQGPLTMDDLNSVPSSQSGRSLRSRASRKPAPTTPQRASTRSTRQAAQRKLSTHSRNCPFSPHRAADGLPPASSTPDRPAAESRPKQRTLRLKRNIAGSAKRLFLTPEKKKELFSINLSSLSKEDAPATKEKSVEKSSKRSASRSKASIKATVDHLALQHSKSAEKSPDIADHFITANESPIQNNLPNSASNSPSIVAAARTTPKIVTKGCKVQITPLKESAIHRWLEAAVPVVEYLTEEEDSMAITSPKDDQENSQLAGKCSKGTPRNSPILTELQAVVSSSPEKKVRVSRKRSSRQANLPEPRRSKRTLKEDNQEERGVEELEEAVDEVAPLPAASVVLPTQAKVSESADDSIVTDDEWSTINDIDLSLDSVHNHSSVSNQMHTPSGSGRARPRLAHSADGGAKRFGHMKRWFGSDSKGNSSMDRGTSGSRLSNNSTPGRLQKRLSASRHQEMEAERRRELKERMKKDLKRLQEREERLAQEREARKRANEERRIKVLAKREETSKEKINSLRQTWEKKEQFQEAIARERRDEELRRKTALEKLRKQNEQREREERERRAAEARRQREEVLRRMKEESEKRARDTERRAKEEAERRAKEEAARKAKEEAERRAKEEAARKLREEEERRVKEDAARKEAERRAKEEARRAAEAARRAREEERRRREEEERKRALQRERALQLEMARREQELAALRNAAASRSTEHVFKKTRRSDENYDITDLHSDQETDDDEDPRKKVPHWATKSAMLRKCRQFWQVDLKWWNVFRPAETLVVDLNSIFSDSNRTFRPRTSSAIWHTPPGLKLTTPKH